MGEWKNNPENSSTIKVTEHISSGFSMSRIKRDLYRGKNWLKKFFESWREYAMKIINLKKIVVNKRAAGILWKRKNLLYL